MKRTIDLKALLAPIPGDNPAGEDLRYTQTYEEIKEARRADDQLNLGDWQRELKKADWDKVITAAVDALTVKTKDLLIAAWLTEALVRTEGFEGLAIGFNLVCGLLNDYWDHLYPEIEDGDMDFRVAPIEFMNEKLWVCIKEVPLTDAIATPGYSWFRWQESREVGYETDTRNRYGDVDENKKKAREEKISEGKLTAEEFDSAVNQSSRAYFEPFFTSLTSCIEAFNRLDAIVDEKFGSAAPRLADLRESLEVCERLAAKILKEKREKEPAPKTDSGTKPDSQQPVDGLGESSPAAQAEPEPTVAYETVSPTGTEKMSSNETITPVPSPVGLTMPPLASLPSDAASFETARWQAAVRTLQTGGIKKALEQLFAAASSAPSIRERNRYRLLMAKICLKADRPDLARPIVEELYSLVEELHLERWESPVWIAEILDALYQCLTKGEPSDSESSRARDLFQKLCTTDVTKAMIYKL